MGYGDFYPVTTEGRAIAAMLMTVGVGLFGMLSGVVVSWFVTSDRKQERAELAELQKAVSDLKALVSRLDVASAKRDH